MPLVCDAGFCGRCRLVGLRLARRARRGWTCPSAGLKASCKRTGPSNWASFLVLLWCSFFLESSTRLLLRRRVRGGSDVFQTHACDIFLVGRGSVMMSAAGSQFAIEARSTLLHLLHAPNARGRRARELSVEAVSTAALTGLRRGAAAYEPSDLSRASLHKNARASQGTPRDTASSAPTHIAARSTALRPRAPPWTRAPRARRRRVRTARSASPPW